MGREYTIGEAAELLNVSRDALRFYEKKNLVTPVKKENGYRYYSEEDISMLLDILFLRKLQCSIQDIQKIYEKNSADFLHQFLKKRVLEEEEQIRKHQLMLRQLTVSCHNCEKVLQGKEQYSLRPIPKTYLFSEIRDGWNQARDEWFKAADGNKGLEHCYLHEQLIPKEGGGYRHLCYLVLEEFAVNHLGLEEEAKALPFFQYSCCLYTVYVSRTVSLDMEIVQDMQRWAAKEGIALTGEVHAHYLWNFQKAGKLVESYLEVFMPVEGTGHAGTVQVPAG